MKIKEIFALWDKDSKIDASSLDVESLNIPILHNKYDKIYVSEKLILNKLKAEYAQLKLEKKEFYNLGPTEETRQKGWQLPARGKILKQEVDDYLTADPDIIAFNLRIGTQEEKIELLKSIMDTIKNRTWHIGRAIDFIKWKSGA